MTGFAVERGTEAFSFQGERPVTTEVVREHNLNEQEYGRIVEMLGRTPTLTELGVFSALWSEHCSYKHSKPVLGRFPPRVRTWFRVRARTPAFCVFATAGRWPSRSNRTTIRRAVEPYQGAATGVGGILRDVFTMGARPVACSTACVRPARHSPQPLSARRRGAGVGDYGNCVGDPDARR